MEKRFGDIENVEILAVSTLLDPRFIRLHFKNPLACANAVNLLQCLYKEELKLQKAGEPYVGDVDGIYNVDANPGSSKEFNLWSGHHTIVERTKSKQL
ncbi:unnamed protein product [Acanthoscelides obtectus]|uniref:Uncharacterized protein n=1 Tax=Acanthoscelides obtectus TaxID=200917 RepID=A0A9P0K9F6_ACAOB|nr:unnamed protein product [Acanthoscelides obtectus]CAK1651889.1 hypothetical protein AOBTE_LOCUS17524 [Acanthoscelides obtectus]